jgi:hypothetical protein
LFLPLVALAFAASGLPAAPTPPVRLAVIVSVDGLSWSELEAYRPWLTGGLGRLLREGRVETSSRYRHLNTETCPGHAALVTGAPPRVTGIVANKWVQRYPDGGQRVIECVDQPAPEPVPGQPPMFYEEVPRAGRLHVFAIQRELQAFLASGEIGKAITRLGQGPEGETVVFDSEDAITLFNFRHGRPKEAFARKDTIRGPGNLRVATLGDQLAARGGRTVTVSAKDRSAIFLAGRNPGHTVYWFDQGNGRFVTSAAYTAAPPRAAAVVEQFNQLQAGSQLPGRFGLLWRKLPDPEPLPASRPVSPLSLYDYQLPSLGIGFDHRLDLHPKGYFRSLYQSPFTDDLVLQLALALVDDEPLGLGRGPAPDLLGISFSAHDVVAHSYGSESEEALDTLRRLDAHLERLLIALQARFGGGVVLALSADHGFCPIPEAARTRGNVDPEFRGGRLLTETRGGLPTFYDQLDRLLIDELCLPPGARPIQPAEGWNLSYNHPALPLRTIEGRCGPAGKLITARELDEALPRVVQRGFGPEIREVLLTSQREQWPADDPDVAFAIEDFDRERSGDATLVPELGVITHWDPARGSMHGSQHDYDTHVPLIFWGAPFRAQAVESESTPYDLAPTLARLLGVSLPEATGRGRLP